MWINPCAQVIFDSDPAPKDISGPAGVEMMSQAMIRCLLWRLVFQQRMAAWIQIHTPRLFFTEEWWMRKGISLWLISCLMRTHFASARETLRRGWITCLKICNYAFCEIHQRHSCVGLFTRGGLIDFYFCVLGTITRSQGSTIGTWKTKPARATRRTTSSSFEMEMAFTTMSLRRGKTMKREGLNAVAAFNIINLRPGVVSSSLQSASEQEKSQGWNSVDHKRCAGV